MLTAAPIGICAPCKHSANCTFFQLFHRVCRSSIQACLAVWSWNRRNWNCHLWTAVVVLIPHRHSPMHIIYLLARMASVVVCRLLKWTDSDWLLAMVHRLLLLMAMFSMVGRAVASIDRITVSILGIVTQSSLFRCVAVKLTNQRNSDDCLTITLGGLF